jgi:hypothetical protein
MFNDFDRSVLSVDLSQRPDDIFAVIRVSHIRTYDIPNLEETMANIRKDHRKLKSFSVTLSMIASGSSKYTFRFIFSG